MASFRPRPHWAAGPDPPQAKANCSAFGRDPRGGKGCGQEVDRHFKEGKSAQTHATEMRMLTFHISYAISQLSASRMRGLERAKKLLAARMERMLKETMSAAAKFCSINPAEAW